MTTYMPSNSSTDNVSVPTAPIQQNDVNNTTFLEHHLRNQQPIAQVDIYGNNQQLQLNNPYLNAYNSQLFNNVYDTYAYQFQNPTQAYTGYNPIPSYQQDNVVRRSFAQEPAPQHCSQYISNEMSTPMYTTEQPSGLLQSSVKVELEDSDLWKRFHAIGTEMIITKSGRRIFPPLRVNVKGLDPNAKYVMTVEILPSDRKRYKYNNSNWIFTGKAEPQIENYPYVHPDCPMSGSQLMKQPISFKKLKITNNPSAQGQIVLNSLHKYFPRINVLQCNERDGTTFLVGRETFPETEFIAVTAYQNEAVTHLKINHNPFAKGFRETNKRSKGLKRDHRTMNDETELGVNMNPPEVKRSRIENYRSQMINNSAQIAYTHSPSMQQTMMPQHGNIHNGYMVQNQAWH